MYVWLHSCVRGRVLQHRQVTCMSDLTWLPGLGVTPQVKKHLAYALIHPFLNSLFSLHSLLLHLQLCNAAVHYCAPSSLWGNDPGREQTTGGGYSDINWRLGCFSGFKNIGNITWLNATSYFVAIGNGNWKHMPLTCSGSQGSVLGFLSADLYMLPLKTLTPYNPLLLILSQTLGHISLRPFLVRF